MTTEHKAPETLKDHWQVMTLRNKEQLRYAVTLTMQQAHYCTESELGHWELLDEFKASQELRYLRNRLNAEIYGNKWHKRLKGRKPDGLYFVPVIQGRVEKRPGNYWSKREENKTPSYYSDEYGEIHFPDDKPSTRRRLQNLHYHCFIDRDLSCAWNNDIKEMVEVRGLSEMTVMIQNIWNETAYGSGMTKIDVQDIWDHPRKHEGWSDYITSEMFDDCEGYDTQNTVIP